MAVRCSLRRFSKNATSASSGVDRDDNGGYTCGRGSSGFAGHSTFLKGLLILSWASRAACVSVVASRTNGAFGPSRAASKMLDGDPSTSWEDQMHVAKGHEHFPGWGFPGTTQADLQFTFSPSQQLTNVVVNWGGGTWSTSPAAKAV